MTKLTRYILSAILFLGGLLVIGWSFSNTFLDRSLLAISHKLRVISGELPKDSLVPQSDLIESLYNFAKKELPENSSSALAQFRLGQAALLHYPLEQSNELKQELVCYAIDHLRQSIALNPALPESQIYLGQAEAFAKNSSAICNRSILSPASSPTDLIMHGVNLAPYDSEIALLAAKTLLSIGQKSSGLKLLSLYQQISPDMSDDTRHFIYSQITNADELRLAATPSLPEIQNWITFFAQNRPIEYVKWRSTFEQLLLISISKLYENISAASKISPAHTLAIMQINDLNLALESDLVRPKLDQILGSLYELNNNTPATALFQERAKLKRLPILKAILPADHNPETTMLSGWVTDTNTADITLDNYAQSIGFYISPSSTPQLLVIEPDRGQISIDWSALSFYASDDNLNYYEYRSNFTTTPLTINDKPMLVVHFQKPDFRYLKIYFKNSRAHGTFHNPWSRLIHLYGQNS